MVGLIALLIALLTAGQPLHAQGSTAEDRARALVFDYYERLDRVDLPRSTGSMNYEECVGTSLEDCFAGDPECMHPSHGAGFRATLCSEPERLEARRSLLERLDSLGRMAPESDWIVGQRVHLAWKNGELDRALAMAESCRASSWWCQALRGFVLHERQLGGEAQLDSAMTIVPRGMYAWVHPLMRPPARTFRHRGYLGSPSPDRGIECEWNDLTAIIGSAIDGGNPFGRTSDGTMVRRSEGFGMAGAEDMLANYRSVPCGENDAFETRYWWLADPLWSVPGNERRTEHLVRNLRRRLRGEIVLRDERASDVGWSHAVTVAFGTPNSWGGGFHCSGVRECASIRSQTGGSNIGSFDSSPNPYVNGGYSFTPDARRFYDPMSSQPADWALVANQGHERMITPETWHNLEHFQSAVLRREGGLLALAAARLPVIVSTFDSIQAALAMGRPADLEVEVAPGRIDPTGVVRASASVADAEWMASLEILGAGWRARARHGATGPALAAGYGLSAPVLVDERFEQGSLELMDAMLPTTVVAGNTAGVYFEVYGANDAEPLQLTVSAVPLGRSVSLLGRMTRLLGFGSSAGVVTVTWSEPAANEAPGRDGKYITLDLGALARDADYNLVLSVIRADGTRATSARNIHLGG